MFDEDYEYDLERSAVESAWVPHKTGKDDAILQFVLFAMLLAILNIN